MNLRLELTNTRESGRRSARNFNFEAGPITFGRSSQASVVIEGEMISRTHMTIDLLHGTWHLTHQGSMTPTLINGTPAPHGQPRRLNDGDVISVGDYNIRASYGRETSVPELEPIRDSSADLTMARASFMAAQAKAPADERTIAAPQAAFPPAAPAAPGPAGRVVPSLVIMTGETGRLELREVERAYVIGRAAGCDLMVANTAVSRRHAIARFDGTRIYVRDAGSRNPLRVNGRPIFGETPLAHGDVLSVGPMDLRVVTEAEESIPALPPMAAGASGVYTEVMPQSKAAPWAPPPAAPAPGPRSMPVDGPRWDQVAQGGGAPDWAASAAPPPPAPPPPPPPPVPVAPAAPSDWSAMAAPIRAPAAAPSWDVPPAPAPPAPPPAPAWDLPAAGGGAPAPAWSPPPPVAPPPPPPPPPPAPPQFAAPPPPAIPEPSGPAPSPSRAPSAGGLGPAPKVVARRASSHKGWLVAGVISMLAALTAGIVLLVVATSR